ncbi:16S rRNA (cytosine(1402)-N(4))-methyltransferase RsmH [Mycoplasma corogypsi]|uniref:16S rRNA (cytosine(1402)-N(4))-methyltransferase RsmH n=1 Tax=Mycoplasma corogypsi TaxID=2106 RepID=UPI0038736978
MEQQLHFSVLLDETIDSLHIKEDGIYVDLTLGMGGHSAKILEKLTTGKLFAFDKDSYAIKTANERLKKINNNYELIQSDFKNIKSELAKRNIYHVDGIIADLGISSPQIDQAERGFSYNKDAKLDMRMDTSQTFDAHYLVNNYTEEQLASILWKYADVKLNKKVAKAILQARPINTTLELVNVIKSAYPAALLRQKNPAKAVFQALRIEVNNELESLNTMLSDAVSLLNKNATLSIITFHSIEDKIVKDFYKNLTTSKIPSKLPIMEQKQFLTKQIKPNDNELELNNRSRSAKLRTITKLF